jgi:hypothetical protein
MALTGELSDFSLAELIELFCNQRKSGLLKVNYSPAPGLFYIKEGELVDARLGILNGEEAVYSALKLPNAAFRFSSDIAPLSRTIQEPWTRIVLEGLRRMDEESVREETPEELVAEPKSPEPKSPEPITSELINPEPKAPEARIPERRPVEAEQAAPAFFYSLPEITEPGRLALSWTRVLDLFRNSADFASPRVVASSVVGVLILFVLVIMSISSIFSGSSSIEVASNEPGEEQSVSQNSQSAPSSQQDVQESASTKSTELPSIERSVKASTTRDLKVATVKAKFPAPKENRFSTATETPAVIRSTPTPVERIAARQDPPPVTVKPEVSQAPSSQTVVVLVQGWSPMRPLP